MRRLKLIMFIIDQLNLAGLHYEGGMMMGDLERINRARVHRELAWQAFLMLIAKN